MTDLSTVAESLADNLLSRLERAGPRERAAVSVMGAAGARLMRTDSDFDSGKPVSPAMLCLFCALSHDLSKALNCFDQKVVSESHLARLAACMSFRAAQFTSLLADGQMAQ